jgi:hypothetical protein
MEANYLLLYLICSADLERQANTSKGKKRAPRKTAAKKDTGEVDGGDLIF